MLEFVKFDQKKKNSRETNFETKASAWLYIIFNKIIIKYKIKL